MKPISYHPKARLEADSAAAYYFQHNPGVPNRFLDLLEKLVTEIQQTPHRWPFEAGTSVRRRTVGRYPFKIFYQSDLHETCILAIAHTSRRPGYWKSRIVA